MSKDDNESSFSSFSAVTLPPSEIIKIEIIMLKTNLYSSLEFYNTKVMQGAPPEPFKISVITRLQTLYDYLEPALKRRYNDYKRLSDNMKLIYKDAEAMRSCIRDLNFFLDEIGLTRIDTIKIRDNPSFGE